MDKFSIGIKKGQSAVAGCLCDSGVLNINDNFKIYRNDIEVFDGAFLCETLTLLLYSSPDIYGGEWGNTRK